MSSPIVLVTQGDIAGIGPELVAKMLADQEVYSWCRPVVVGDPDVIQSACAVAGVELPVRQIAELSDAQWDHSTIHVIRPSGLDVSGIRTGELSAAAGQAAVDCMTAAFDLARSRETGAVVFAPMNKQAFHMAGYESADELEYLADRSGVADPVIAGAVHPSLWTVAVTAHVPFRSIAELLNVDLILARIRLLDSVLRRVGAANGTIAVAALNVHASEGGRFGAEEAEVIAPAIEVARQEGLQVEGPIPADTVFVRARSGEFGGVVCMYHDQANIARKLLATWDGATVFLGLPVVCATTAHGTAFDVAGRGIADPGSLRSAVRYASLLSELDRI